MTYQEKLSVYNKHGKNLNLKRIFVKGENAYNVGKLDLELRKMGVLGDDNQPLKSEDVSDAPKGEELSDVPTDEDVSDAPKGEELPDVPTDEDVSDAPKGEELSDVPTDEDVSDAPKGEELPDVPTDEDVSDAPKGEETPK